MNKETAAKLVNRINKQIDENIELLHLLVKEFANVETLTDYRIIELEASYLEKHIRDLKEEVKKISVQVDL